MPVGKKHYFKSPRHFPRVHLAFARIPAVHIRAKSNYMLICSSVQNRMLAFSVANTIGATIQWRMQYLPILHLLLPFSFGNKCSSNITGRMNANYTRSFLKGTSVLPAENHHRVVTNVDYSARFRWKISYSRNPVLNPSWIVKRTKTVRTNVSPDKCQCSIKKLDNFKPPLRPMTSTFT
jgi:hypothetical protein